MDPSQNYNIQANISHSFSPLIKVKYEIVYDKGKSSAFGPGFDLNRGRRYLFAGGKDWGDYSSCTFTSGFD